MLRSFTTAICAVVLLSAQVSAQENYIQRADQSSKERYISTMTPVGESGFYTRLVRLKDGSSRVHILFSEKNGTVNFTRQIPIPPATDPTFSLTGEWLSVNSAEFIVLIDKLGNITKQDVIIPVEEGSDIVNSLSNFKNKLPAMVTRGGINQLPYASAGENITVQAGSNNRAQVTMNGSGSYDPDGTIVSYIWRENGAVIGNGVNASINFNAGVHVVTLTVIDDDAGESSDDVVVTVLPFSAGDTTPPVVRTRNITVSLNAQGSVSITPQQVDNGSTDNVGIVLLTLDRSTFSCSDRGNNSVILTAFDAAGNSASASATVTVRDVSAPVVVTRDITVTVSPGVPAQITPQDINNGSSDNCGISSLSLDKTVFTTDDTMELVTLTAVDASGNIGTGTANVLVVVQYLPPVANAGPDQIVTAGGNGTAMVTLDGTGSLPAPGSGPIVTYIWRENGAQLAQGASATVALNVGIHTIELEVTDTQGSKDTDIVVIDVRPAGSSTALYRINSGGNETIAYGQVFQTDAFNTGNDKRFRNVNITSFPGGNDELYLNERTTNSNTATFGYSFPVPNGTYKVRLHFAETWFGAPGGGPGESGRRVFSVSGEGVNVPAWANIDIFNRVGALVPLIIEADITVSDGMLDLLFFSSRNRPKVNGIEVIGGSSTPMPPVAVAGPDQQYSVASGGTASFILNGTSSFDPDGQIVAYRWFQGTTQVGNTSTLNLSRGAGVYTFRLEVTDNSGLSSSDEVLVTIQTSGGTTALFRINSGGRETTAYGELFQSDEFNVGDDKKFRNANLTSFPGGNDDLYLFERTTGSNTSTFGYEIPVPNGSYLVRLHFAETWFGAPGGGPGEAGRRVFSVTGEGQPVPTWSNIDIFDRVGALVPLILEATMNVTDGSISLLFQSSKNRPKVNGIEVIGSSVSQAESLNTPLDLLTSRVVSRSFVIMPNPAKDHIAIVPQNPGIAEAEGAQLIRIYDFSGLLLMEKKSSEISGQQIDISTLAPGPHIIQVIYPDITINQRFIKD